MCISYYTILYYTILYYTILYYTILYYTILYYTILYYTLLRPRSRKALGDSTFGDAAVEHRFGALLVEGRTAVVRPQLN